MFQKSEIQMYKYKFGTCDVLVISICSSGHPKPAPSVIERGWMFALPNVS